LTVEFSALDDEDVRPMLVMTLLLTFALGRKVGSASVDEGGWGGLTFEGECGREGGLDWRVITLAVTFTGCELLNEIRAPWV